jgi:hypothetical protein
MSDYLHYFESAEGARAAVFPFPLDELIDDWASLRTPLLRNKPASFNRTEWAYLIGELAPKRLASYVERSFGTQLQVAPPNVKTLFRPRGTVAVWLPNNVSLLGPLSAVALSLTGNTLFLKSGSQATDLTAEFLAVVHRHLRRGHLRSAIERRVRHETFDRNDERNRTWAEQAEVRIVFGADSTADEIHGMQPAKGASISFTDKRSTVWMEPCACTDEVLKNLIRVFAIYGTAGCSSPRSVVLLDGSGEQVNHVKQRLIELWDEAVRERPQQHIASSNYLCRQIALALGWDAELAGPNAAVIATGGPCLAEPSGPMFLPVSAATLEEAIAGLPANVQTIGYALTAPNDPRWLTVLGRTGAKRFVPISQMHHFGPVWDGRNYWRECFEQVDLAS